MNVRQTIDSLSATAELWAGKLSVDVYEKRSVRPRNGRRLLRVVHFKSTVIRSLREGSELRIDSASLGSRVEAFYTALESYHAPLRELCGSTTNEYFHRVADAIRTTIERIRSVVEYVLACSGIEYWEFLDSVFAGNELSSETHVNLFGDRTGGRTVAPTGIRRTTSVSDGLSSYGETIDEDRQDRQDRQGRQDRKDRQVRTGDAEVDLFYGP